MCELFLKKGEVMKMKKILSVVLAAVIMVCVCALTGCSGAGKTTIDLKNYVKVGFDGYNGKGTANVEVDTDAMLPLFKSGSVTAATLYDSFDAAAVESSGTLSNGDTVHVKVNYNEQMLKNANIEVKNTELTFTVSGLNENKVDVFADTEIKVDGISPECTVEINYKRATSYGLHKFPFEVKNEKGEVFETLGTRGKFGGNLKDGDKITLTLTKEALDTLENYFNVEKTSLEYTVKCDSKYILSAADLSEKEREQLDKIAEEYLNSKINEMSSDTRDLIVSAVTGLNIGALKAGKSQRIDDLKVKGLNSAYVGIGEITDWGVKKEVKRAYYFYDADAKYYAKDFFDVLDGEKPLILAVTISDPIITPNGVEYSGLIFSAVENIETANKWITSKLEKLP